VTPIVHSLSSDSVPKFLSILIAEDNEMNQKVIARILQSMQFSNIKIVDTGLKALQSAKEEHFDVILMDIMMPEMGGIEATERIRSEIPRDDQPAIIAITADAFSETRKRCLESGMNDILTKPLSRTILLNVLNKYSHVD